MEIPQKRTYTIEDIYALPDGQRAELIDGQMYMMAPPKTIHQRLVGRLGQKIANYIDSKNGNCEVIPAPFAVFLYNDDKNYMEPDISIICDKTKIDARGCNGAPDWIIEIVSPSSQQMDYNIKPDWPGTAANLLIQSIYIIKKEKSNAQNQMRHL